MIKILHKIMNKEKKKEDEKKNVNISRSFYRIVTVRTLIIVARCTQRNYYYYNHHFNDDGIYNISHKHRRIVFISIGDECHADFSSSEKFNTSIFVWLTHFIVVCPKHRF